MESTIPPKVSDNQARHTTGLYLLCGLLAAVILFADLAIPLGVAGGVPYVGVVLLTLWFSRKRGTVQVAVICSLLTVIGFYYSPPGGEMWKVIFNRALAIFAIWVTAILTIQKKIMDAKREKAVREREQSLEDIKILRGFLPICASCKKIRDDKGYWNQIETYISKNSEADFSHGICPDCASKIYPDLWPERNKSSDS